jgi:ferritin-like metal-binding protein YciE
MSASSLEDQITKYLTDAHSIEEQALVQMEQAPRLAGDPELARIFREHLAETREHEQAVRGELTRRGAEPSTVKDVAGKLGGWGMVLFARLNPDTPGKLAAHGYSYEHMELAAYELLKRMAQRAGDGDVVALCERIGGQERAMADRVAERWDRAVDAPLKEKSADDLDKEVVKYLRDAHAIEGQAIALLETGPKIAGFDALKHVFEEHLPETREQQRMIDERLSELGSGPARFQAGALRMGALNLGTFFKLQPDTPVKLAGFAYAFEALEAGAYELLARTADRAGDTQTAELARRILAQEQAAAEKVAGTWDAAVDAVARETVGVQL